MAENEKKQKLNPSIIRIILCVVVILICILGLLDIVTDKYTIPVASVVLMATAVWNGISYLKNGKKTMAICIFISAFLLLAITIGYIIMTF